MPDKTRRILDVDVREVSLVDRAANLRQFLVLKRLSEEDMGAFIDEERSESVTKAKKEVEAKEEEAKEEEAKEEEAKEEKDAKKDGAPAAADQKKAGKPKKKEDDAADEEEAPEDEEAEVACESKKKGMNPGAIAGMLNGLKGKGLPSKAVEEVVAWLESQKKSGAPAPEGAESAPASKKGMKKNLAVAIMEDGSIIVEGEEISKARKFTESRTGTVKEVVTQLLNLLHDVDADAAKAVVGSFSQLPLGSVPASEVKPQGTEGKVSKQLEDENAELKKRLEVLEKSRADSKGLPGDQTDGKPVKKSLWNNVL
jgi:hypothetical protein